MEEINGYFCMKRLSKSYYEWWDPKCMTFWKRQNHRGVRWREGRGLGGWSMEHFGAVKLFCLILYGRILAILYVSKAMEYTTQRGNLHETKNLVGNDISVLVIIGPVVSNGPS